MMQRYESTSGDDVDDEYMDDNGHWGMGGIGTDIWQRKIQQIAIAGRFQNICIRSSTLPSLTEQAYYEEESTKYDNGHVLRPVVEEIIRAVDKRETEASYYSLNENTDVEKGKTEDTTDGKLETPVANAAPLAGFHEIAGGNDGTYLFVAVDKQNPLFNTRKSPQIRRKDFDDNATYAFGIIAIILGIASIITGIAKIGITAWYYNIGTGIWCGFVLFLMGLFGILSSKNVMHGTPNWSIGAGFFFSLLCIPVCVVFCILAIIGITYDYSDTALQKLSTATDIEGSVALHIIDIAVAIGGIIVSFVIAFNTGRYIWSRQHYTVMIQTSKLDEKIKPKPKEFSDVGTEKRPISNGLNNVEIGLNNGGFDSKSDALSHAFYNDKNKDSERRYKPPQKISQEDLVVPIYADRQLANLSAYDMSSGYDTVDAPATPTRPIPRPPTVYVDPPRAIAIQHHRQSQADILQDQLPQHISKRHRKRRSKGRSKVAPSPDATESEA